VKDFCRHLVDFHKHIKHIQAQTRTVQVAVEQASLPCKRLKGTACEHTPQVLTLVHPALLS
jgi:hypothetical protein